MLKSFRKYSMFAFALVVGIMASVAMPTVAWAGDNFFEAKPTFNVGAGIAYQEVVDAKETQATTSIGIEWVGKKNWVAVDLGLTGVETKNIESAYTGDVKVGLVVGTFRPYVGIGYKETNLAKIVEDADLHKLSYGVGARYDVNDAMFVDVGFKYSDSNNKLTTISTHYRF